MLSVDLAGGREAGRAFFDALTIPERTASLGSVHTMVVHPPTSSHRALDAAALAAAGITRGPAPRLAWGWRTRRTSLADFGQALEAARPPDAPSPARRPGRPRRRSPRPTIATIAARRPAARPVPGPAPGSPTPSGAC